VNLTGEISSLCLQFCWKDGKDGKEIERNRREREGEREGKDRKEEKIEIQIFVDTYNDS